MLNSSRKTSDLYMNKANCKLQVQHDPITTTIMTGTLQNLEDHIESLWNVIKENFHEVHFIACV